MVHDTTDLEIAMIINSFNDEWASADMIFQKNPDNHHCGPPIPMTKRTLINRLNAMTDAGKLLRTEGPSPANGRACRLYTVSNKFKHILRLRLKEVAI